MRHRMRALRPDAVGIEITRRPPAAAATSFGNRALAAAVQTKLEVGPAGDRYEQEADRVAHEVVSSLGTAAPQRQSLEDEELQMSRVQRQDVEDEELQMSRVQRTVAPPVVGAAGGGLDVATESAIAQARAGGRPLDIPVRREMESAFGADFSGVRVHTGPQVDHLNHSLQAKAFTTGRDVFVRRGDYAPGSRAGRHLIAHELTHVVQQGHARSLDDRA